MNINEVYGGDWLRAEDLPDRPVTAVIANWEIAELQDERTGRVRKQIALAFRGAEKRLGLNKTNAGRIAELYGPEVEHWVGKPITLTVERVEAFGKLTNAIRVQLTPTSAPAQQPAPAGLQANADPDEDIPW